MFRWFLEFVASKVGTRGQASGHRGVRGAVPSSLSPFSTLRFLEIETHEKDFISLVHRFIFIKIIRI